MKSFNEFVKRENTSTLFEKNFQDIFKVKNKWVKLSDNEKELLKDNLFELIDNAYKPIGGYKKIQNTNDVLNDEWDIWRAVDIDTDPDADIVSFGKTTKYGTKLSGVGHDGEKESVREFLINSIDILKQKGYFIEVSKNFAQILINRGVNIISDEKMIKEVLGKDIEFLGKHPDPDKDPSNSYGWYKRKINNQDFIKLLVGKPK